MHMLAAQRVEYQTDQNQKLGNHGSAGADRRSTADDRVLEGGGYQELLFVIKT